jgi:hypothetical protein
MNINIFTNERLNKLVKLGLKISAGALSTIGNQKFSNIL